MRNFIIFFLILLSITCTSYRRTDQENVKKTLEHSVSYYNQMAIAKADSEKYDEAIEILRDALFITPWDPELYLNLGSMFYYADQLDSAEFMFKRAVRMRPSFAMAFTNLSKVYIKQNQYKEALDAVDNAIEQDPQFTEAWLTKSEIYLDNNLIDEAVTLLENQIEKEPEESDYHSQLGYIFHKTGLVDDAINEYLVSLNLEPNEPTIYFNLGNAFFQQCRLADAQSAFSKALELDSNYVTTLNNYSLVLINLEQYREAINTLNKALEKKPNSSVVLFNLSIAMDRIRKYDQGLEYINKALNIDSTRSAFFIHKGNLLKNNGELQPAIKEYENALKIDSSSTTAYNNLGNILLQLQRVDEANLAFQKSIELYKLPVKQPSTSSLDQVDEGITMVVGWCSDPYRIYKEYAMLFNNLGRAYMFSDQPHKAISAFSTSINYYPDLSDAYEYLAAAYYQADQTQKGNRALALSRIKRGDTWYNQELYQAAREQYLEAQSVDPSLPLALAKLALLNKQLGQDIASIQFENAKKAANPNIDMYSTLADYCLLDNNFEQADEYFSKAINLETGSITLLNKAVSFYQDYKPQLASKYESAIHFLKGNALGFANLQDAAIEQYKQSISIDSTNIKSLLALGVLYMKKNHIERAKTQYNKILQIDPENIQALLGLGTIYGNQQNYEQAIEFLQKTIAQDSTNAQAHYTLGVNYYFLNDLENAKKHTLIAQELGIEINNDVLKQLIKNIE